MELELIPADTLIALVKTRRVLWDKHLNMRDKSEKLAAWKEICSITQPNFDKLNEKEQNDYVRRVRKEWFSIRDEFLSTHKRGKVPMPNEKKGKPDYDNDLNFLLQTNKFRTKYTMPVRRQRIKRLSSSSTSSDDVPSRASRPLSKKITTKETKHVLDVKQDQENPQISFIKGVLPSMASFTVDEALEFQAGVLALIKNIRDKRNSDDFGMSFVSMKEDAD